MLYWNLYNMKRNMGTIHAYKRKDKSLTYFLAHIVYDIIRTIQYTSLFLFFRILPLSDRIVATAFNGSKFGDNSKYIIEKVHEVYPNLEIVWLADPSDSYNVPDFVKTVKCSDRKNIIKRCYYYYTSKVWINTHLYDRYLHRRKQQLIIETWHGGLGIKKIEGDVDKYSQNFFQKHKINKTSRITDVFISNSDFLSDIYRRAFGYTGTIWKIGNAKDDPLVCVQEMKKNSVHKWFGIDLNTKIIVYAPTYRGVFEDKGIIDMTPYNIDYSKVVSAFKKYWKCENCIILVRWHPSMANHMKDLDGVEGIVIDGSSYPEMQDIIIASDAFISDYSSCIFEAALKGIPCHLYTNDFDEYLGDRGAYFALEDLPFDYAIDNEKLIDNIISFDGKSFNYRWEIFEKKMGLYESGVAALNIANMIVDFCFENGDVLKRVKSNKDSIINFFE